MVLKHLEMTIGGFKEPSPRTFMYGSHFFLISSIVIFDRAYPMKVVCAGNQSYLYNSLGKKLVKTVN